MEQLDLFGDHGARDPSTGPGKWGNHIEVERRNRIRLCIAAYAYEEVMNPIMSDGEFDKLASEIRPKVSTGHAKIDKFFRQQFNPSTSMWISKHPELDRVRRTYERYYQENT